MLEEKEWPLQGGALRYVNQKDKITVTGVIGNVVDLVIPDKIEDKLVTSIGKKAFLSRKYLRQVMLPDTVEVVEDWAFAYCDGLEKVSLPSAPVTFGKAVFLACSQLKQLIVAQKDETVASLLAAAVTTADAYYLLNLSEAGQEQWFAKWDARLLTILRSADSEGYSKQVLCGEEDYGSTDLNAFLSSKRKSKVRLLLLRLLYDDHLQETVRMQLEEYLRDHTKGKNSEETWQVILLEHGQDRNYYELFASLQCISRENLEGIVTDIGDSAPEMKAYFLRFGEEDLEKKDFFSELLL